MEAHPPNRPRIVIVCGPTGIGKTRAGIRLAERFGGEIVGADSMQIYRRMDIGTAKPTPDEKARIPHHLVDVVEPDAPFSAADYARLAGAAVDDLARRGTVPVVVGGTGLYIKSLIYGLFDAPATPRPVRDRLHRETEALGLAVMYERLRTTDPDTAASVHPNDRFRILRALEVYETTGRPASLHRSRHGFAVPRYDAFRIGLVMDRDALYERIDRRVDLMVAEGLLSEVASLLDAGYPPSLKSMQAIGYRHMVDHIQGRTDWEETLHRLKRDTRRYAKRQLTWFRADPAVRWTAPGDLDLLEPELSHFLGRCPCHGR